MPSNLFIFNCPSDEILCIDLFIYLELCFRLFALCAQVFATMIMSISSSFVEFSNLYS